MSRSRRTSLNRTSSSTGTRCRRPPGPPQAFDFKTRRSGTACSALRVIDPSLVREARDLLELMQDGLGSGRSTSGCRGRQARLRRRRRARPSHIRGREAALAPNCAARTVAGGHRAGGGGGAEVGPEDLPSTRSSARPRSASGRRTGHRLHPEDLDRGDRLRREGGAGGRLRHRRHHPRAPRATWTRCSAPPSSYGASRLCSATPWATPPPTARAPCSAWTRAHRRPPGPTWTSTGTATTTAGWRWRTRSPPSRPAPTGCTARPSGIGERVGNASMDQLLVNLKLMAAGSTATSPAWCATCATVAERHPLAHPGQLPARRQRRLPHRHRRHAAAIIKAKKKGDAWLADRVYSGVPAGEFGKEQEIEIGHMSGMSNVRFWLGAGSIRPPTRSARRS